MRSPFKDRRAAGFALARHLSHYANDPNVIVVGLPPGGVVVAAAVSEALNLPLDVFIARKLRAPCDSECALGALTEMGNAYIDHSVLCRQNCLNRDLRAYLEHEIVVQTAEILRQRNLYREDRPLTGLGGHTVILVDEGVVTGATFFAAVDGLRKLGASRIAGAVPVAPVEVFRDMRYKVDELTVLLRAEEFTAISDYYVDFPQTSNDEVRETLHAAGILPALKHSA